MQHSRIMSLPSLGAAVHERLQQSGYRVMQEEMDTFQIGVLIPFMYGWFGPVRPGALISLCHPGYQVPSCPEPCCSCTLVPCPKSLSIHMLLPLQGPCIHRDCRHPAFCAGNRFTIEDGVLHVIWVRLVSPYRLLLHPPKALWAQMTFV